MSIARSVVVVIGSGGSGDPDIDTYHRPASTDHYLRPASTDTYIRPA